MASTASFGSPLAAHRMPSHLGIRPLLTLIRRQTSLLLEGTRQSRERFEETIRALDPQHSVRPLRLELAALLG